MLVAPGALAQPWQLADVRGAGSPHGAAAQAPAHHRAAGRARRGTDARASVDLACVDGSGIAQARVVERTCIEDARVARIRRAPCVGLGDARVLARVSPCVALGASVDRHDGHAPRSVLQGAAGKPVGAAAVGLTAEHDTFGDTCTAGDQHQQHHGERTHERDCATNGANS